MNTYTETQIEAAVRQAWMAVENDRAELGRGSAPGRASELFDLVQAALDNGLDQYLQPNKDDWKTCPISDDWQAPIWKSFGTTSFIFRYRDHLEYPDSHLSSKREYWEAHLHPWNGDGWLFTFWHTTRDGPQNNSLEIELPLEDIDGAQEAAFFHFLAMVERWTKNNEENMEREAERLREEGEAA